MNHILHRASKVLQKIIFVVLLLSISPIKKLAREKTDVEEPTSGSFITQQCPFRRSLQSENDNNHSPWSIDRRDLTTSGIIHNNVIMLGINDGGELNAPGDPDAHSFETTVGLRYFRDGGWYDSTAYGCKCEGFGISAKRISDGISFWGGSNQARGEFNLSPMPLISNGREATAIADVTTGPLRVTHNFFPSPLTDNLYQVVVTLENTSLDEVLDELRYRRAMDWDIPPTPFSECVSIFFSSNSFPTDLEYFTDDGFESTNPINDVANSEINFSCKKGDGCGPVYDNGPEDHGAMFNFLFMSPDNTTEYRTLGPGKTFSFNLFYGAAQTKDQARVALAAVGSEVVSYGYSPSSSTCNEDNDGSPNVFMFGFSGVGGTKLTNAPTISPAPSNNATSVSTFVSSMQPTSNPTQIPSITLSFKPSFNPVPSATPTIKSSNKPSIDLSSAFTEMPSFIPSIQDSTNPSVKPSMRPTIQSTTKPSTKPTVSPSYRPSVKPSIQPSCSKGKGNGCMKKTKSPKKQGTHSHPPACPPDSNKYTVFWTGDMKTKKNGKMKPKIKTCKWLTKAKEWKLKKYCSVTDNYGKIKRAAEVCTGSCNSC